MLGRSLTVLFLLSFIGGLFSLLSILKHVLNVPLIFWLPTRFIQRCELARLLFRERLIPDHGFVFERNGQELEEWRKCGIGTGSCRSRPQP
jgi:hypothetical protein